MEIQAPVNLLPRKKCQIPAVKETGWGQQSGHFGEDKNLLSLLALHPEATSLY